MSEFIDQKRGSTQTDKATLIRTIDLLRPIAGQRGLKDAEDRLRHLSEKLVNNRFHLAVLGQMKRGKSSVVNALLGTDILPTGILPLTSLITHVRFGSSPAARIIYRSGNAEDIEPRRLGEYITEAGNPGNRKQVASAQLLWPSSLLQLGIDLVDTPGIGSTHRHNTATTENYLREIDAAIVVLSVDPPITAAESEFLKMLRCGLPRILFVVNKIDVASAQEVEVLMDFLEHEIAHKCGIARPEIFPVSARGALAGSPSDRSFARSSGISKLAGRLEYFAAKEKEQALLESVAQAVLPIAETLRFAANIGDRTRLMDDWELTEKKRKLEVALSDAESEFSDLRHLLQKESALIVGRVEADLEHHIQIAAPAVRKRLGALQTEHPGETREKLGTLLDNFVTEEIRHIYEDWRIQEDERVARNLSCLSERFVVRANRILETLQQEAGSLFEIPFSPINIHATLAVESGLYYYTEPAFKFMQEKLIFLLPRKLQRRLAFHRMLSLLDMEIRRNAGRIRYDYLERVEKAIRLFEKQLSEVARMVIESVSMALAPDRTANQLNAGEVAQMSETIAQCAAILEISQRSPFDDSPQTRAV